MASRHALLFFFLCLTMCALAQNRVDSLRQAIETAPGAAQKVAAYVSLMEYHEDGQLDSARKYLRLAMALAEKAALKQEQADLALKNAQYYIMLGIYDSAALQYDAALPAIEALGSPETETTYYGDRGIMYFYQGDFNEALGYFEKALAMAIEHELVEEQMRFLNANALALSYLGRAEEGIVIHEQAIDLAERLSDSISIARSLNNIGLIYDDMKAYDQALDFYQRALTIKERISSESDIINSLYNVATMYQSLGEQDTDTLLLNRAKSGYEEVLERAQKMNYGKMVLFAQFGMAKLETFFQNYQQAIAIYRQVIDKARVSGDQQILRVSRLNIGVNYLKVGDATQALTYLNACKEDIIAADNPSDLSKLYLNLALAYETRNSIRQALDYYKLYQEQESLLNSDQLQQRISDFEVKYETKEKEAELLKQRALVSEQQLAIRKKNTTLIILAGLTLLLVLIGYLIYSRQKLRQQQMAKEAELQTALARIETQNKMQEQRLRISRDLHDNIGSQLTFIISSIDNLKYGLKNKPVDVPARLEVVTAFTRTTINDLRDTIWAMNSEHISLEDLITRLSNFINATQSALGSIRIQWRVEEGLPLNHTFSSIAGINMYRCIQEAFNNAVKHAIPTQILLELSKPGGELLIKISDDGSGFDVDSHKPGNGLANMKKRIDEIGGRLSVSSTKGTGTTVQLSFSLE